MKLLTVGDQLAHILACHGGRGRVEKDLPSWKHRGIFSVKSLRRYQRRLDRQTKRRLARNEELAAVTKGMP